MKLPRWESNFKMDLREIEWGGMNWIRLAKMNLRVPENFGKFFRSCADCGFSRRAQLHGISWLPPTPCWLLRWLTLRPG
jgi:hypothetical protein